MAAQVSHASMAFLTSVIRKNAKKAVKSPIEMHRSYDIYANGQKLFPWEEKYINQIPKEKLEKVPALYKRNDLHQFAKEAFQKGEDYFFTKPVDPNIQYGELKLCDPEYEYIAKLSFEDAMYEQWIEGPFTKVICGAKDNCYTELSPEEFDDDGTGRTLTCIGFRPLSTEIASQISKKYQLY